MIDSMHQYPKAIVGVLIYNKDGKIFLGKSAGKIGEKWTVVGGHLEWGESLEACAVREVKEETNLSIHNLQFLGVQESIFPDFFREKKHMIFFDYAAELLGEEEVILDEEHTEFVLIDPKRALIELDISPSTRVFIEKFLQSREYEE